MMKLASEIGVLPWIRQSIHRPGLFHTSLNQHYFFRMGKLMNGYCDCSGKSTQSSLLLKLAEGHKRWMLMLKVNFLQFLNWVLNRVYQVFPSVRSRKIKKHVQFFGFQRYMIFNLTIHVRLQLNHKQKCFYMPFQKRTQNPVKHQG